MSNWYTKYEWMPFGIETHGPSIVAGALVVLAWQAQGWESATLAALAAVMCVRWGPRFTVGWTRDKDEAA